MSEDEGTNTIDVAVGGTFVVSLPSLPTTGYTWEAEYEAQSLAMIRANDLHALGDGVGSGGEEEFEFQAVAPGHTVVRLVYRRPWLSEPKETRTFTVTVHPVS